MATYSVDTVITQADHGLEGTSVWVAPGNTGNNILPSGFVSTVGNADNNIAINGGVNFTANDLHVLCSSVAAQTGGATGTQFTMRDGTLEFQGNITSAAFRVVGIWDFQDMLVTKPETETAGAVAANFTWGAFGGAGFAGNGFDAGGNHTVSNISNNRFWGNIDLVNERSALRMTLNSFPPGTTFNNNSFYNGDLINPLGCFVELPPLNVSGATFGLATRSRNGYITGAAGQSIIRITGGPNRNNLNINDNWAIWPGNNYVGIATATQRIAIDADGGQSIWHVDMVLPPIFGTGGSLHLGSGQNVSGANQAQQRNLMSWNPNINNRSTSVVLFHSAFNLFQVPQTFANNVQPTLAIQRLQIPATFNGFLIEQNDTGALTNTTNTTGVAVSEYVDRSVRIFDYPTQVNTLVGSTFTTQFGEEVMVTPADTGNILPDLTYASEQVINYPEDAFLNGQPSTFAPTDIADGRNIYPALKAQAYADQSIEANRLRVVPSAAGLRYLSMVTFDAGATEVAINSNTGAMTLPVATTLDLAGQTHDFRNENDAQGGVDWTGIVNINNGTISSGLHFVDVQTFNDISFINLATINFGSPAGQAVDITDWTFTTAPALTAVIDIVVTVTREQANLLGATTILGDDGGMEGIGNRITLNVEPLAQAMFNFDIPATFQGMVGLAYRDLGTAGAGPWTSISRTSGDHQGNTSIYEFTDTLRPTIETLSGGHIGFSNTSEVAIFTVGSQFRMTLTQIDKTSVGRGQTGTVVVLASQDVNYNIDPAIALPATINLDVREGAISGRIDIQITGAEAGLSGEQTNRLLGLGRNDADYLQEVWDAGRILDYITFPTTNTSRIVGDMNVRFSKPSAGTPQQILQAVEVVGEDADTSNDGFISVQTDGTTNDVINFPPATGLSPEGAAVALQSTPRLMSVEQMNNYLVSNGADGAAVADRLIGIRPKAEGFNPDGDYTIT